MQTFYGCAVWLPIAIPALVATAVHAAGWSPSLSPVVKLVQLLLMSLMYGGLPYAALAAWATWWIGRRLEPAIRHGALQAPLWMVAAWLPFTAVIGGLAGRAELFLGLAGLGILVILPLGYAYVTLVFLLRRWLGRAGALSSSRAAT
ncbi:MAG TPA: hypothetical protein VGB24_20770 [Longimicrobium sp.]|uniref:hypothetical protein n=1 Tax=Longimicrobium sp. TaxID=2029185 RepID=UPI002EDB37AA